MDPNIVSEEVAGLAEALGPDPDDVIVAMNERASADEFPTVGPAVGGWLALLVELVDARRVFEFGSGFGYSAYWMARELPPDGEVILTEIDADELDDARSYFADGGLTDRARFEHGDAIDVVSDTTGAFDVVLIDNEKPRYVEAFEAVRDRVRSGGVVVADNAVKTRTSHAADVLALLEGEDRPDATETSRGIAAYLERVREDPEFETALLPLGEGVAVSRKR